MKRRAKRNPAAGRVRIVVRGRRVGQRRSIVVYREVEPRCPDGPFSAVWTELAAFPYPTRVHRTEAEAVATAMAFAQARPEWRSA